MERDREKMWMQLTHRHVIAMCSECNDDEMPRAFSAHRGFLIQLGIIGTCREVFLEKVMPTLRLKSYIRVSQLKRTGKGIQKERPGEQVFANLLLSETLHWSVFGRYSA